MPLYHIDRSCQMVDGMILALQDGVSRWGNACWGGTWLDNLATVQSMVIDHLFEEVRLMEFPNEKSRYQVLFGCDETELRYWQGVLGHHMHKLMIIRETTYDRRDASLLRAFPVLENGKFFDPGFARECARLYWRGESVEALHHSRFRRGEGPHDQPHFECLIHLPAVVGQEVQPAAAVFHPQE